MDLWLKQCERTEASVQTLWQTLRFVEIGNRNLARRESLVIKSKLYGSTGRGGFGWKKIGFLVEQGYVICWIDLWCLHFSHYLELYLLRAP